MRLQSLVKLLFFTSFAVSAISCTRPDSEMSQISLSLASSLQSSQKLSGQSETEQLGHLVINVSGGGLQTPIVINWDRHDHDENAPAPESFNIEVPKGDDRLIQVLAVYGGGSGGMKFYYGDVRRALKESVENVAISVSSIGSGQQIVGGRVQGRYLSSADAGPSGRVTTKYFPPGKPGLVIERNFIIKGWFSLMMLDGDESAKFGYELDDGSLLWGRPMKLSDTEFNSSSQVLRVSIPVHLRSEQNGGASSWVGNEADMIVYGWFYTPGNPALVASKQICAPVSPSSLNRMSVYVSPPPGSPPAMPGQILLPGESLPSLAALTAVPNSVGGYKVKGGSNATCLTDAANYINHMDLTGLSSLINGNGQDGASYHFAPMKAQINGTSRAPYTVQVDNPSQGVSRITGQFLPGVDSDLINRFHVYKRVSSNEWRWNGGGAPCSSFEQGQFGFSKVGVFNRSGDNVQLDVPMSTAERNTGVMLGICYGYNDKLYEAGTILYSHMFQSYGGGYNMLGSLKIDFPSNVPIQYANTCIEARVSNYTMDGMTLQNAASQINLSINMMNTSGSSVANYFATNSDCTSTISPNPSLSIGAGTSQKSFWVKSSATGFYSLNAFSSAGDYQSTSNWFGVSNSYSVSTLHINTMESSVAYGQCYTAQAFLKNSGGAPAKASSVPLTLTWTDISGDFFQSMDCSGTPTSTISTTADTFIVNFSFRVNTGSTGSLDGNLSTSGTKVLTAGPTTHSAFVARSYNNSAAQFIPNQCLEVRLGSANAVGALLQQASNVSLSLSSPSNTLFYSTPNCSDAGTSTLTKSIFMGQLTSDMVYIKATNPGSGLAFNVSDGVNSGVVTINRMLPYAKPFNPANNTFQVAFATDAGVCNKLDLKLFTNMDPIQFYNTPTGETFNITVGAGPGSSDVVYTQEGCIGGSEATQVTFAPATTTKTVWFKRTTSNPQIWLENNSDFALDTYSNTPDLNYQSAPIVNFSSSGSVGTEGNQVNLTLNLSASVSYAVRVPIDVAGYGGSPATPGVDFVVPGLSGGRVWIEIPAGATSANVAVNLANGDSADPGEQANFTINATQIVGATVGGTYYNTLTINE